MLRVAPLRPLIRRLPARLLLAAVLLVVTAAACSRDPERARWARGESVGRLVAQLLQEADTSARLSLGELAPFRWQQLYIFAPRTTPDSVRRAIGIDWPGAEASGIATADTAALLVFTADGGVIAATMHPRDYGDFVPVATGQPLTPDQAVFRAQRPAGGRWTVRRAQPGR